MADGPLKDAPVDVVLVASRFADGSPDQTPGFKYIDEDTAREFTKVQLAQQAASNADVRVRAAEAGVEGGEEEVQDPLAKQREEIILGAYHDGESAAESEFSGDVSTGTVGVEPMPLDTPEGTNPDEGEEG